MRLYIRKIDKQCIDKQISYTKYILSEFLDNKDDQDSIICEGKNSHYIEKVKILLATDPRFYNNIKSVLSHEGKLEVGDIMVMYKKKSKYLVELVKNTDTKYASLILLFDENDRHLLINVDDNDIVNIDYYAKFKKLMEWFVKQLNINNNLEQGERKSGQGYKEGAAIRNQYSDWRDYGTFTLDCNLVGGFQGVQSSVNYINKTGTGIDIRPQFNKNTKEIVYFEIDLYNEFILADNEIKNILNKKYYLSNLNLFDEL